MDRNCRKTAYYLILNWELHENSLLSFLLEVAVKQPTISQCNENCWKTAYYFLLHNELQENSLLLIVGCFSATNNRILFHHLHTISKCSFSPSKWCFFWKNVDNKLDLSDIFHTKGLSIWWRFQSVRTYLKCHGVLKVSRRIKSGGALSNRQVSWQLAL